MAIGWAYKRVIARLVGKAPSLFNTVLILFGLTIVTVCTTFFLLSLTRPYVGTVVVRRSGQWQVDSVDPSGLAHQAGVAPGYKVLEVNGQPVDEFASNYVHVDLIRQKAIQQVIVVDEGGHQKSVSIGGSSLPKAALFESISLFATGLAFCLVGFFVMLKKPASGTARVMYLLCLAIAVCLVSTLASERDIAAALTINIVASATFPWLGVHFFMLFPASKQLLARNRFGPLFIYVPTIGLLLLYALIGRARGEEPELWFRLALMLNISVGLLLCLACMSHSYLTNTYARLRQQVKIVGSGTLVAIVPFLLLSILPEAATGAPVIAAQFAVLSTISIPLSAAYALLRYQLLDIDLIISRSVVYASLAFAFAACYTLLGWILISHLPVATQVARVPVVATLAILALLSFRTVMGKVQLAIDHAFYKDRYDYKQTVTTLTTMFSNASDLQGLGDLMTAGVTQVLALHGACLLLSTEAGQLEVKSAYGIYSGDDQEQQRLIRRASRLREDDQFPHKAPPDSRAAFFVPLAAGGERVGILCLAPKAARTDFTVDDIYLISTLSKQAGVIVENLSLLQEARQHEESIQEWEKLYETMAHTLQVGIYVIENGKFVFVNPKFQTDLGFEEDELLKADPLTLIHPEDRETVRENAVRMLRGELSSPFEYRAIARSGETRVGMGTLALIQRKRRAAYLGYHMDITERKQAEQALKEAALQTLDALAGIEEANDPYTAGHSTRVTELALRIATEMGLGEDELNVLRIAGPLHDMGKIGITQSVLNKPSKLTQAEWLMIRAHPVMSAETAERVVAFRDAVPAIRHHHERWDGTGYPDGLKEEHIPLPARILAVADAFEAMTSERPYRGPLTQDEALAELRTGAGTQWDPDAVKALLRIVAAQNLPASF